MLEAVLQALPFQMAVLDYVGTILFVNAAWERFARENGAPSLAETSKGLNYLTVADQAEGDRSECALEARQGIRAVLDGALPLFTLEYPCHSPEEQRWFLLYAAPLPGWAGLAVVAHLNITERKLLEEQVSGANREMSDFLSLVSHEVRTPLTSLNGYMQLARQRLQRLQVEVAQGALSPETLEQRLAALQQSLEQVEAPARRLNRLIMDLAEVANIQSERLDLHRAPCDLAEIVAEVVEEQQLAWPNREIDLRLSDQAVMVQADRDRIGQVVTNYLTNALKYAPAERPIEVSLSLEAEQVRVEVRDQGPGVPPEKQELIWQRFYRIPGAKAERPVGGNLGLGLYICRSIITQHGGRAGVESAPGSGATFWFTLPLDRSSAGDQQTALAGAAPSGKDGQSEGEEA
jgi:signal transduction histidine kinase